MPQTSVTKGRTPTDKIPPGFLLSNFVIRMNPESGKHLVHCHGEKYEAGQPIRTKFVLSVQGAHRAFFDHPFVPEWRRVDDRIHKRGLLKPLASKMN